MSDPFRLEGDEVVGPGIWIRPDTIREAAAFGRVLVDLLNRVVLAERTAVVTWLRQGSYVESVVAEDIERGAHRP